MCQENRKPIFTVNSPLNTVVTLHENTLVNHIVGDHSNREVFADKENLQIVANVIEHPDFIEQSTKNEYRHNYYSLVSKSFNEYGKPSALKIVTEQVNKVNESVVTMMPISHSKLGEGGEILYDRHKT